jgi:hypothetical protein
MDARLCVSLSGQQSGPGASFLSVASHRTVVKIEWDIRCKVIYVSEFHIPDHRFSWSDHGGGATSHYIGPCLEWAGILQEPSVALNSMGAPGMEVHVEISGGLELGPWSGGTLGGAAEQERGVKHVLLGYLALESSALVTAPGAHLWLGYFNKPQMPPSKRLRPETLCHLVGKGPGGRSSQAAAPEKRKAPGVTARPGRLAEAQRPGHRWESRQAGAAALPSLRGDSARGAASFAPQRAGQAARAPGRLGAPGREKHSAGGRSQPCPLRPPPPPHTKT